jgi:hypothetical protein
VKVLRGNVPASEFTQVANSVWVDPKIGSEATRILCYLLSLPEEFDTNRTKIMRLLKLSDWKYRHAWTELADAGYIKQWRKGSTEHFVYVTSLVGDRHVTDSHVTDRHVTESHVTDQHALVRRTSTKTHQRKTIKRKKVPKKNEGRSEFFSVLDDLEVPTPKRLRVIRPELDQGTSVEIFEAWKQQR